MSGAGSAFMGLANLIVQIKRSQQRVKSCQEYAEQLSYKAYNMQQRQKTLPRAAQSHSLGKLVQKLETIKSTMQKRGVKGKAIALLDSDPVMDDLRIIDSELTAVQFALFMHMVDAQKQEQQQRLEQHSQQQSAQLANLEALMKKLLEQTSVSATPMDTLLRSDQATTQGPMHSSSVSSPFHPRTPPPSLPSQPRPEAPIDPFHLPSSASFIQSYPLFEALSLDAPASPTTQYMPGSYDGNRNQHAPSQAGGGPVGVHPSGPPGPSGPLGRDIPGPQVRQVVTQIEAMISSISSPAPVGGADGDGGAAAGGGASQLLSLLSGELEDLQGGLHLVATACDNGTCLGTLPQQDSARRQAGGWGPGAAGGTNAPSTSSGFSPGVAAIGSKGSAQALDELLWEPPPPPLSQPQQPRPPLSAARREGRIVGAVEMASHRLRLQHSVVELSAAQELVEDLKRVKLEHFSTHFGASTSHITAQCIHNHLQEHFSIDIGEDGAHCCCRLLDRFGEEGKMSKDCFLKLKDVLLGMAQHFNASLRSKGGRWASQTLADGLKYEASVSSVIPAMINKHFIHFKLNPGHLQPSEVEETARAVTQELFGQVDSLPLAELMRATLLTAAKAFGLHTTVPTAAAADYDLITFSA